MIDYAQKVQCPECEYVELPYRDGKVRSHRPRKPSGAIGEGACIGVGKLGIEPTPAAALRASKLALGPSTPPSASPSTPAAKAPPQAPAKAPALAKDASLTKTLRTAFKPLIDKKANFQARIDKYEMKISVLHQAASKYRKAIEKIDELLREFNEGGSR